MAILPTRKAARLWIEGWSFVLWREELTCSFVLLFHLNHEVSLQGALGISCAMCEEEARDYSCPTWMQLCVQLESSGTSHRDGPVTSQPMSTPKSEIVWRPGRWSLDRGTSAVDNGHRHYFELTWQDWAPVFQTCCTYWYVKQHCNRKNKILFSSRKSLDFGIVVFLLLFDN